MVVASNYGQDRHPGWYRNLNANPRSRVIEISGAVIVFGAYRRHTDRVGREIPIVRLRPVPPPL